MRIKRFIVIVMVYLDEDWIFICLVRSFDMKYFLMFIIKFFIICKYVVIIYKRL